MSASASGSAASQAQGGPNKYVLNDHERTTEITYYPFGIGPVVAGQSGAKFVYSGEEGDLTFTGDQIQSDDTALGTLLTVALKRTVDFGGVTFTLVLPDVRELGTTTESFRTIGIKTTRGPVNFISPGAAEKYKVVHLHGKAADTPLPQ